MRTRGGGAGGGGADLTEFGIAVIANHRTMEQKTRETLTRRITELERALTPIGPVATSV